MVWEDDPTLFLYKTGYPSRMIYTARCQNITKAVPLEENDFDSSVPYSLGSFQGLLRSTTTWTRADFEKLIDYISNNHYLVNCQGVVILKVFTFDENVNLANSVPIYVRLLDVIDLTNFGFRRRPSKVPPMKPQYFVDGGDALVEDPPVIIKPVVCPPVIQPIKDGRPKFDPSWMIYHRDWLDAEGIVKKTNWAARTVPLRTTVLEITREGTNFGDDNTTNVRGDLFYGLKHPDGYFLPVKVVLLDSELSAQGRFDPKVWGLFSNGIGSFPVGRMIDNTSPNLIIF